MTMLKVNVVGLPTPVTPKAPSKSLGVTPLIKATSPAINPCGVAVVTVATLPATEMLTMTTLTGLLNTSVRDNTCCTLPSAKLTWVAGTVTCVVDPPFT